MPPPVLSRRTVAIHEAGHALPVLLTPLRDYVEQLRLFEDHGNWFGDIRMDGRDSRAVDPDDVFEFARQIAGPVIQLTLIPDSAGPEMAALIQQEGSLLRAVRYILDQHLEQNHPQQWWPDLQGWSSLCLKFQTPGTDFLQVETALVGVLNDCNGRHFVEHIADLLEAEHLLDRARLLGINTAGVPALAFPQCLNRFH